MPRLGSTYFYCHCGSFSETQASYRIQKAQKIRID